MAEQGLRGEPLSLGNSLIRQATLSMIVKTRTCSQEDITSAWPILNRAAVQWHRGDTGIGLPTIARPVWWSAKIEHVIAPDVHKCALVRILWSEYYKRNTHQKSGSNIININVNICRL